MTTSLTIYLDRETDAAKISEYDRAIDNLTPVQIDGAAYMVVGFDVFCGRRIEAADGIRYEPGGMTYEFRLYPAYVEERK